MKTYQDLLSLGENQAERMRFLLAAVESHKGSEAYKIAADAQQYLRQKNVTITKFQKLLYTITGEAVPDNYSANHKVTSNFFKRFVTQQTQYLLGNGLTLENDANKEKLGKSFDRQIQNAAQTALVEGASFCFWNLDHLEIFRSMEFVPLWDEETGALRAGIRFFQLDEQKPLRLTLYEGDGYTEYIKRNGEPLEIRTEKRPYRTVVRADGLGSVELLHGDPYPAFPIIPLYGNQERQSELVGMRNGIDSYDLIKSGFANDLDDASMIYWALENSGGMTDMELAKFKERMHTIGVATMDDGATASAHTVEVPYQSRVAYLERLEQDLYSDYQALNVTALTGGEKTATEISAAYQPFDSKCDAFEYCILEFLEQLFALIGIEDSPAFRRSRIVNQREETEMVLMAAEHLDEETLLSKLPWLTPEEVQSVLDRKHAEEAQRAAYPPNDPQDLEARAE